MPVNGRLAEERVDTHSRALVGNIWKQRKQALEVRYNSDLSDEDIDLTSVDQEPLRTAFARQSSRVISGREASGEASLEREPSPCRELSQPSLLSFFVPRNRAALLSSPHHREGSGSDGQPAMERS